MTISYIGYTTPFTTEGGIPENTISWNQVTAPFICPSSGNVALVSAEAYLKGISPFSNARIAVVDDSGNLVGEWNAQKSINNTTFSWVGQTLDVYSSLVGGQHYYAVITVDGPNVICMSEYVPYLDLNVQYGKDYTGGFPDPLTLIYNQNPNYGRANLRIGYAEPSDGKMRAVLQGTGNITATMKGSKAGAWIYQSAALLPPISASTISAGSTGSLTGAFYAKYTYIDLYGNESNPSTVSSVCTLSGQQLDVLCGPSTDVTVWQVGVYVLAPSASNYKLVGTMSASTSNVTFSVTVTETQIVAGDDLVETNDPMPYGKYVAIFNDRLCVAGDPSLADKVVVSNPMFHRQFDPQDYDRVVSGDGQPIKGFGKYFDNLIVGKSDSYYISPSQGSTVFRTIPYNADYGILGQPSIVSFLKRMAYFSKDGIYGETGNVPEEISEPIRHYIRRLNTANLTVVPPKQISGKYRYYKRLFFAVREAAGVGENDTILVYNWENSSWTKYKGIEATYLASIQNTQKSEYLWGGDSLGRLYRFGQPSDPNPNSDYHTGLARAIEAFAETPWIHLPRAKGVDNWDTAMTEGVSLNLYVGGECPVGVSYITMQTAVAFDMSTTYNATFTTTHTASQWPNVTCDPKLIESFAGNYGNFQYVKFRISNNNLHEHFKIHKMVFGFRVRPIPGK